MSETSTDNKEIWKALLEVQGELEGVTKDATNPHYKSSYADRTTILEALRPLLQKHGLVLLQALAPSTPDTIAMVTSIVHAPTGQSVSSQATCPLAKSDAQGYGSAATYLSRYSLVSLFALPLLDDDGNDASPRQSKPTPATGDEKDQPSAGKKMWGK